MTNRLVHEKSPYLLQHQNNPVDWYPWGEEAFAAAREQDKPIFLSIGYSTCHWCHVMEREVFEDAEAAAFLNGHFISIKVDREERPDVDKLYMDALHTMQQRGGWPLSIVMTPDKVPFFGGTYFPKQSFIVLMTQLEEVWHQRRDEVLLAGEHLTEILNQIAETRAGDAAPLTEGLLQKAQQEFCNRFDPWHGGFGDAPKFPPAVSLMLLLRIHARTGDTESLAMVEKTLDRMARGGMYDHLGGGFHRYSTDKVWLIPHFEKMLYDNALLAVAYLEAFQVTQNKMYAAVARETLDYVSRFMTDPLGGFYTAEDADSEGVEGRFYVWRPSELEAVLSPEEFAAVARIYGVTARGNFEGDFNIFHLQDDIDWGIKDSELIKGAHEKLFNAREKRVHPLKDQKIITSWNGLMLTAMAKGYQVLGEPHYLEVAQRAALFIKKHLYQDGRLFRRYKDHEVKHPAMLDDFAYLIQGLLQLYQSDFDEGWLHWAVSLQQLQDELFWDEQGEGYFYAGVETKDLIVRSKDFTDEAIPNGNGISALNLLWLCGLTHEKQYQIRARKILKAAATPLGQYPTAFSMLLMALDHDLDQGKQVAVVGEGDSLSCQEIISCLHQNFLPNKVLAFAAPGQKSSVPLLAGKTVQDGQATVYVCEDFLCQSPTHDVHEALRLLRQNKK